MANKYHNKKIVYNGMEFDSIKECNRYCELVLLQRAGKISDLEWQVKFQLFKGDKNEETGERMWPATYIADFVYTENGKTVVEDCKGYRTDDYKLKRKWMREKYGIWVKET